MEVLSEQEIALILQRLETYVADLEHDVSARTFYAFVLVAQALAGRKHALCTMTHIRTCVSLAHRMRAIRQALLPDALPWTPLTDVLELIHAEATRLTSLYGVARPECRTQRRALQQAFRAAFTHATGKAYQQYGPAKTAKERATITTFWDDALRTALARFQANDEVHTLDEVMACLPAWTDRHHERWSTQGWREPSAKEVIQVFNDYLMVCEACLGTMAQLASAALAHAPVVDRVQVTRDVEQSNTAQVQALRAQLSALPLPKDVPKAQHAPLRKAKAQLQHALQTLLSAQEAEITRRVKHSATARHKLETLVTTASGYHDTLLRKVGKVSVDVLPRMIWIYDFDRQGNDDWRTAKREAKRFVRQVRQARAPAVAAEAP